MKVSKVFVSCLILFGLGPFTTPVFATLTVAAAATMRFAMDEISALYTAQTGDSINVSYGSTGNLYRQIVQGAPFDVLLAADESYVLKLHSKGVVATPGVVYAEGRIGLLVANGVDYQPELLLQDLPQAISKGIIKRFAIANPEHAPYGMRAMEALRSQNVFVKIKPALVFGENIAQATQFVTTGAAQAGIVAQSLALSKSVSTSGKFVLIPKEWHMPLTQRMVQLTQRKESAQFMLLFRSSEVARILEKYGYEVP